MYVGIGKYQISCIIIDALMAITDWQNNKSLFGHALNGPMPQHSLEQVKVWENFFQRGGNINYEL
jgi:hypothetical protein